MQTRDQRWERLSDFLFAFERYLAGFNPADLLRFLVYVWGDENVFVYYYY
jgi:hypothetical protein